ncbi:hypothetical protein [Paenibacillus sp. YYML68]|uniref:hypothetical protein n=1 Tax=Paenibacillus sp. YYML68 TaxID=2909250 RepID=UPI00249158A5|nr:hypothetical protein [Paenibacillus sp. YYML68]
MEINGYLFVFLGSERYRQSGHELGEYAYLSTEHLQWLKQTLEGKVAKAEAEATVRENEIEAAEVKAIASAAGTEATVRETEIEAAEVKAIASAAGTEATVRETEIEAAEVKAIASAAGTEATVRETEIEAAEVKAIASAAGTEATVRETEIEAAEVKAIASAAGTEATVRETEIEAAEVKAIASAAGTEATVRETEIEAAEVKAIASAAGTEAKEAMTNGKPFFVFLHQPLPGTVSGSRVCCAQHVAQHEELKRILAAYPQAVIFSGHTHWELKLPHTLVRDSFTMVNSSSVSHVWNDDGQGGERELPPEESEGLFVDVFDDRIEIKGRDFYRQRWIPEARFIVPVGL